jgi:hypothetical protein
MTQIAANVYRIPRRFNWLLVAAGFAMLALVLMLPRWGTTDGAARGYFETGLWLRSEIPLADLHAPFAYRLAVPALAAFIPGELHHVFALLNWVFVTVGACLATATVRRLGFGTTRALAAGLLVLLSWPTLWYAPGLLVDPAALCMRMLFVFALLGGRLRLALGAALAATAISEENILMLGWLIVTQYKDASATEQRRGSIAFAGAAVWLIAVRGWIAPGVPGNVWLPNLGALQDLANDWHAWLALAACAGLVLPLGLIGLRRAPARLAPLKSLLALLAAPVLVALLSMRVDGCIVWGLYPFLIPFAVALGLPQQATTRPDVQALRVVRTARRA